jgi:ferredoxin
MADRSHKLSFNVAGKFYVDDQCINCGVCNEIVQAVFGTNDEEGYAFVQKQPEGAEEEEAVREAAESCPVEAIGDDGDE